MRPRGKRILTAVFATGLLLTLAGDLRVVPVSAAGNEGVTGLPADVTSMLSIAGVWQPTADQLLNPTPPPPLVAAGDIGNSFFGNIRLPNGREGFVVTGWSINSATTLTPIDLVILEQQPDGTLQIATSKYVSDPQTNGGANVIVGDFNGDGVDDFMLPAHNEAPFVPAASTAYLSGPDGKFTKVALNDKVEAHSASLTNLNGVKTVFTSGYYSTGQPDPHGDTAVQYAGGSFQVVNDIGIDGNSSIAVGDLEGKGTYTAVCGDCVSGPGYPYNENAPNFRGLLMWRLSGLQAIGQSILLGTPYFNGKPQYASYPSAWDPVKTHNMRIWLDDFNHDGKLDVVVEGAIWGATGFSKSKLQMFQNGGGLRFSDVTDVLGAQYDENTTLNEGCPQVRDIDGSGINSYLLGSIAQYFEPASANYILLNDGTGTLQVALHETLNTYVHQILAWLKANPAFPPSKYYIDENSKPVIRAYLTADGKLNFVAEAGLTVNLPNRTPFIQKVFVNVPLKLDISRQFTRAITVSDRNGSGTIRTFAGDDTIMASKTGGKATVDGGLGTNTAVYDGPASHYTINKTGDSAWTVRDNVGAGGEDTLVRIQRLQFQDITLANTPGTAASLAVKQGGQQTAAINTAFLANLQVTVLDASHAVVPNATVTFTAPGSGASGLFNGSTTARVTTDSFGVATAPVLTANAIAGGPYSVTAAIAGTAAPATFPLTNVAAGVPYVTAVVNGASFQPGIVSGSWVVIQGGGFTDTARTWDATDFTDGPNLPTTLNGVQATFNGVPAAMYYVSPNQLNVQAPTGLSGNVSVRVSTKTSSSNTLAVNAAQAAPALFTYAAGPTLYPAAYFLGTTTLVGDPAITGSAVRHAHAGDVVLLFATGLGASPSGTVLSSPIPFADSLTVKIGSQSAQVLGAALIYPGEFQINVVIPDLPAGTYPLTVTAGGQASQPAVMIPIGE
jgi:uncharacterized protein (TIGR03437 family)